MQSDVASRDGSALCDGLGPTPLTDACLKDGEDCVVRETRGSGLHVAAVRDIERGLNAEIERLRAAIREWVAAHDQYNGAIGLNGTQAENDALLAAVTWRYSEAWRGLRSLVGA